jgi:hypothetical protein
VVFYAFHFPSFGDESAESKIFIVRLPFRKTKVYQLGFGFTLREDEEEEDPRSLPTKFH